MSNPIEAARIWLESEPPTIQNELAFLIGAVVIEKEGRLEETIKGEYLESLIRWLTPSTRRLEDLRKSLLFRATVDFSITDKFTREGWNETIDHLKRLQIKANEEEKSVSGILENSLNRAPFMSALWIQTGKTWYELRENALSDSNLKVFMNTFSEGYTD